VVIGGGAGSLPSFDLIAPDGSKITSSFRPIQTTLEQTGLHTILVTEYHNGDTVDYALDLQCLTGKCVNPPSIIIGPPGGAYLITQSFDIAFIVIAQEGVSVGGINKATMDSEDIKDILTNACSIPGTIAGGGQSLRCSNLSQVLFKRFGEGIHTLGITLDLSDGTKLSNGVTWDVVSATE
jgi:hypothetical protein